MTNEPDVLYAILDGFTDRVERELEHRLQRWPFDFAHREAHEVIGALMARQVTLASQVAASPNTWNGHTAPLLLRAMADVYVTLAWALKEPDTRCKKFIEYGLGQQKLELEHRRAEMQSQGSSSEVQQKYCETIEAWINAQRATFLTEVNLGSWSGLSTRAMAEEAGCLDFYNYVYAPFSACVHSMWHHIARYNLKTCRNPLHRFHGTPTSQKVPLDLDYLHLAAEYLRKTFAAFDEGVSIKVEIESAYKYLCEAVVDLAPDDTSVPESAAPDESPRPTSAESATAGDDTNE